MMEKGDGRWQPEIMNYEEIMTELNKGQFRPLYFLMGEEAYFIDMISDHITENALDDAQKSFNQIVLYGRDTNMVDIINTARRFPMMSDRQVVVVKEAQGLKDIEDLIHYVETPLHSTILVVNYKYRTLDKRKRLYKSLEKNAVIFESKRMYEERIPAWITSTIRTKGKTIEPKAAVMLGEFLGNDLGKISGELEKLMIALGEGDMVITPLLVEKHIGFSKDYNNFELNNAISERNVMKANRIVRYFGNNQKNHPIALTITSVFNHFARVLQYHFLKDKTKGNVASVLGINPYFVKDYEQAARNFPPAKAVQAISLLREFDLKSKGFGNSGSPPGDLLKELIYKLMH